MVTLAYLQYYLDKLINLFKDDYWNTLCYSFEKSYPLNSPWFYIYLISITQSPILVPTLAMSTLLIGENTPKGIFSNGNWESSETFKNEAVPYTCICPII